MARAIVIVMTGPSMPPAITPSAGVNDGGTISEYNAVDRGAEAKGRVRKWV